MITFKPFKALRPPQELVKKFSCPPYDVISPAEARNIASQNPNSLLHITRAEVNFDADTDPHDAQVYHEARRRFESLQTKGFLNQDKEERFYIYAQSLGKRTQYGIVGIASAEDYNAGIIKKHELTRPEKEDDRMLLTRTLKASIEPVFFSYKTVPAIDKIVEQIVENERPEYDFWDDGKVRHQMWIVKNQKDNDAIQRLFAQQVACSYVADGHHRTAAAARIAREFKLANPKHNGTEAYNYFLAVQFPDTQLQIMDYNRTVADLNGLTPAELVEKLNHDFDIISTSSEPLKPKQMHHFGMYLDHKWYKLKAKAHCYDDNHPIDSLDVTILSKYVLEKHLNIKDLRRDKRIDFVGGIRGMAALSDRVDSGEMAVAFALFPVSMEQLFNIADIGSIMPPKTTWFEPKLRSGLLIYPFEK